MGAAGSKVVCALVVHFANRESSNTAVAPSASWSATIKRHTDSGYQLLWTLCIWWLFIMITKLTPEKAAKIPSSLLLCFMVGTSLNVNGFVLWKNNKKGLDVLRKKIGDAVTESTVVTYATSNPWTIFRFFFVPFCVSTFSVVSAGNKNFVYLFPISYVGPLPDMVAVLLIILVFLIMSRLIRKIFT